MLFSSRSNGHGGLGLPTHSGAQSNIVVGLFIRCIKVHASVLLTGKHAAPGVDVGTKSIPAREGRFVVKYHILHA